MGFIGQVLPAVIVLGVLIFIHELGHFLACRFTGVRVDKFSIGFGPEIFSFQGRETRYVISLIPLGGFVKPSGESPEDISSNGLRPYDFLAQGPGKKFIIAVAGVLMNFVLAYVIFSGIFMVGNPVLKSTVGGFVDGYPAQSSGLRAGDLIREVNGAAVSTWNELTGRIMELGNVPLLLTVERDGSFLTLQVLPKVEEVTDAFGKKRALARIGILPGKAYRIEKYGPAEALVKGGETVLTFTGLTFKAIGYLVTGKLSLKALTGPIGIVAVTSETAKRGLVHIFQLMALLSVSLAVFNLLPFPPLDGGLMVFILIEAVRRKALSFRFQEAVAKAGFALLLLLMVAVMYNDLVQIGFFGKIYQWFQKAG